MTWDPTEFQQTIRHFLDRRGWSQNDLAHATTISQSVINRWMQPISNPTLVQPTDPTLRKLAPVIGISHNELMRQAGRVSADPKAPKRDAAIAALLSDVERELTKAPADEWRERQIAAVRAIIGVHRGGRPNRRSTRQNDHAEGEDAPSYRPLTYAALAAT